MARLAQQSGSIINAVMLGAIAGCGRLPLSAEQFEAAIRADGKQVDANLRGFRAGLDGARAKVQPAKVPDKKKNAAATRQSLEQAVAWTFPALAQATAQEGVRRLVPYQGANYARLYLDRLKPIDGSRRSSGRARQAARKKSRAISPCACPTKTWCAWRRPRSRRHAWRRIAREELRVKDEPFSVHDFLKPGIEEMCQLLPPFLARPILRIAARRGWLGRVYFGMEINSTSIFGYLRFLMLAKLRPLRPFGHRYKQEQKAIDAWLGADRRGGEAVDRPRARGRRMRAADQGLWRHPCARNRQLRGDRGARDPPGAGGPHPNRARRRRGGQRAHRRPGRSGGRKSRQMPRRYRRAWQPSAMAAE